MLGSTGSTLTPSTTESSGNYDVDYLYNMLETNFWKTSSAAVTFDIKYDAGVGNTKDADYLIILGHNLNTVGAYIRLEYSDTGAWAGEETVVFTTELPSADTVYVKEFTSVGAHRYWRIKETNGTMSAAAFMSICIWGLTTELAFASQVYDPYAEEVKAVINKTQGGYISGIHERYSERVMELVFTAATAVVYTKVKAWWDTSGLKNFFVGHEMANNPTEVYLMRPDTSFNNPYNINGVHRDITISLRGRKE